ncbi:selenide,water dikinase [Desulfovibrio intestinalis]|uniref:Selenide,water dikinase n=1 Tax=Desulfovibrio intestinalis TaxID=58621 RepID=A0A7W8FCV2_9BACT|nr:selenide,water dikinase [Desulfovibrio intestinalis]
MRGLPSDTRPDLESRVLAGRARNEDAVVLTVPPGYALVQTVDILAPIVNDAFSFGRIAAANALSDVYAMGGEPWSAMNVAFFPQALAEDDPQGILAAILRGGLDAMNEAGAVLAGGHTVQDDELKYGLAVTGIIDSSHMARNDGLEKGQQLLLTKPLGTGVLATGVKARWDGADESEAEITRWCSRLNKVGGEVIRTLKLTAATDITGFGLGGHTLEMAVASGVCVVLHAEALPLLPRALEYARDGLIPAGSHLNRKHCACSTLVEEGVDEAVESLAFDAQTSGGLLLSVHPHQVEEARRMLLAGGDLACLVGEVAEARSDGRALVLR